MVGTTFDSLTTSLCTKMILHSENEIKKYLSKRYEVSSWQTSTSVPPLVTSLCETLTEGYMYQRMSRGGKEEMERGKLLIDQAIGNLKLIADYKLDLLNADDDAILELQTGAYKILSTTSDYSNTFNEDDPLNWRVSSDKLDDISSERD